MRTLALALLLVASGEAVAQEARPTFRWPLIGKAVKLPDGKGLDVYAPEGEAVHAAGDGVVLYAGDELASFGKMVVIRHADGYASAYAYLSQIAVKTGSSVKRGEILGKSGHSGDATRTLLHFELRHGGNSLDPLGYLKPR